MSLVVQIQGVKTEREGFRIELPQLEIYAGEVYVLMGKSGSGKSSFLEALAGFLPLQSGSFQVNGEELSGLPPEKRRLGYVFQKPSLFPHLTLLQNLCFPLELRGDDRETSLSQAQVWLQKVQLGHLGNKYPAEVSGGEAQRAVLARALIAGFPFLLLDEPFTALDVPLRKEIRELLKQLLAETKASALLVSHDPEDALALATNGAILEKGKLIFQGRAEEVVSRFR